MRKIIILDENTSNQIAAGEVIERPASVVKELVENSIDANSTNIYVDIKKGGIKEIKVVDNGEGISREDIEVAFERHATSKIRKSDDLNCIKSLGFRGEALASIASVSKIKLMSKTREEKKGYMINVTGGSYSNITTSACNYGTSITVKDLFFNTPARYKFMKKDYTEASHVKNIVVKYALAHPEISFKLISNNSVIFSSPGNKDLKSAIYSIYGKKVTSNIIKINYKFNNYSIDGFIGNYNIYKRNRDYQNFFVNGRYVKSKIFNIAIDNSYKDIMLKGRKPFVVLNITINPEIIDINVHPSKMEIKFSNENDIYHAIYNAIKNGLNNEVSSINQDESTNSKKYKNAIEKPNKNHISSENNTKYVNNNFSKNSKSRKDTPVYNNDILSNFTDAIVKPEKNVDNKSSITKTVDFNNSEYFKKMLESARIIGQIFNSYILIEYNEKLLLMDQHAAHERILYEKILYDRKNRKFNQQGLVSSVFVELSTSEYEVYKENFKFISNSGFDIEESKNETIKINAIPDIMRNVNIKDTFINFLNELSNKNFIVTDENIAMIACKSAVKANHKLDLLEIKALLNDLAKTKNPMHCPHGRPLIYPISKREIEKNFQRIQ